MSLKTASMSALLALAALAGCGMNADTTPSSARGTASETGTGAGVSAPPAATAPAAPPEAAKGRLVLVATAAPGPYRSFAVTLDGLEARISDAWVPTAAAADLARLNKPPLDFAAAHAPLLLAVGSLPAGSCQALRLRLKSGSWVAASAPRERRALALPKGEYVEVSLDNVAIRPDRTTVVALSVDLSQAAVERATRRITPTMFALADAAKVVGRISGKVEPAAALPRVWACRADSETPIACADADPVTGAFTIADLPAGRYYLRVTAGGYLPAEDRAALYQVRAGAAAAAAPVTLARRPSAPLGTALPAR